MQISPGRDHFDGEWKTRMDVAVRERRSAWHGECDRPWAPQPCHLSSRKTISNADAASKAASQDRQRWRKVELDRWHGSKRQTGKKWYSDYSVWDICFVFSSLCPLQNVVNTVECPTTAQSPTREYSYFHKEAGHLIPHDGVKAQRGQIQLLCNVDGVWFPQGQAGLPPLKCCDCPQMWWPTQIHN